MQQFLKNGKSLKKWSIVAGAFLLQMVFMGVVNNCYSLFIIPVTESMGFSRSAYSLCQSLNYLFCMGSAALGWKLHDKIGFMPTLRLGCLLVVIPYFLFSTAKSLPVFYLLSALIGMGMGLTTTAAMPIVLRQWFPDHYGTALGIALMGSGVGGMLFNPVANTLLERFGWQSTYGILGLILGLVSLPIVWFVLKENPQYSNAARNQKDTKSRAYRVTGRRGAFLAVLLLFSITCTVLIYTLTPYLQDIGYSSGFSAGVASASMAILAAGKLLQGMLLDKWGMRRCILIAFVTNCLGLVALSIGRFWTLPLVLLCIFASCPFGTVAVPAMAAFASNEEQERAAAIGVFTAVTNLGSALSPYLAGICHDTFQSYVPLFVICAVLVLLSTFAICAMIRKGQPSLDAA